MAACVLLSLILFLPLHSQASEPSVVIVGAGPAGLMAAQTLLLLQPDIPIHLIKGSKEGQLEKAFEIENWPGIPRINGGHLWRLIRNKARGPNLQYHEDTIEEVDFSGETKILYGARTYIATVVIIATGTQPHLLKNMERWLGKGIHTCVDCDGPIYANQNVLVLGGGSTATESALALANLGARVTLSTHGSYLKAEPVLAEKVKRHPKINLLFNQNFQDFYRDTENGQINSSLLESGGQFNLIPNNGIFLGIGQRPQSSAFVPSVRVNKDGFILRQSAKDTLWKPSPNSGSAIALGKEEHPNSLTAAAKGTEAALMLAKRFRKHPSLSLKDFSVAILGSGIGGKSAALYALRNNMTVVMIEPGPTSDTQFIWPTEQSREALIAGLNQQLIHPRMFVMERLVLAVTELNNGYLITLQEGLTTRTLLVDGIIANTLEYSPDSLRYTGRVDNLDRNLLWWHTSQENVLVTGDVAELPDLPKQAISAAYSGYQAGKLAAKILRDQQSQ